MSNILAKDFHLYIFDPDASPDPAYVEVAGLLTVTPSLPAWQFEDAVFHGQTDLAQRNVPTLHDLGTLAFTYVHNDSNGGHGLIAAVGQADEQEQRRFKLESPGTLGGFEFYGFVQGYQLQTDKGNHIKGSFTLKVDEPIGDLVPYIVSVEVVETADLYPDYETDDTIQIKVTFSEVVYFVDGGDNPGVTLDIDGGAAEAEYVSGSASNEWIFEYTFQAGDSASAEDFAIESPLVLNDGTIKDIVGQNATPLTFDPPTAQTDLITVTDTSL
jgi:hypothetical protein